MNSTRTIDCVGIVVCVVCTAVVMFVGFKPVWDEQAVAARQTDLLEQQRAEVKRLATSLTTMREQFSDTERAVQANALRLEGVDRLNHRLSRITALATECGLVIEQVEPNASVPTTHYVRVPVRVSGEGGFHAVRSFLHELHGRLPDFAVSSFDLLGQPGQAHKEPQFRFLLDWYAAPRG